MEKNVARRGHRWSQTGTAASDGHPELKAARNPSSFAQDEFAYCGTSTGDLLQVGLANKLFNNIGPKYGN